MASDSSKMGDDAVVELSSGDVASLRLAEEGMTTGAVDGKIVVMEDGTLPSLGERPASDAKIGEWVKYCVSLGADKTFLTKKTEHNDGDDNIVEEPPYSIEELRELATDLGG